MVLESNEPLDNEIGLPGPDEGENTNENVRAASQTTNLHATMNSVAKSRVDGFMDGIAGGLATLVVCATVSTSILVASPAMEGFASADEGAVAVTKGVARGTLSGVRDLGIGITMGAVIGVTKFGVGICKGLNNSVCMVMGKEWIADEGQYNFRTLQQEHDELFGMDEDAYILKFECDPGSTEVIWNEEHTYRNKSRKPPICDKLYETLGLPSNATTAEIKRTAFNKAASLLLSIEGHQNPLTTSVAGRDDDSEIQTQTQAASERFRQVARAYDVLGCCDMIRELYDSGSVDGESVALVSTPPVVSPAAVSGIRLATLFILHQAARKLEPFIGQLEAISHLVDCEREHQYTTVRSFRERKRVLQGAINLVKQTDAQVSPSATEAAGVGQPGYAFCTLEMPVTALERSLHRVVGDALEEYYVNPASATAAAAITTTFDAVAGTLFGKSIAQLTTEEIVSSIWEEVTLDIRRVTLEVCRKACSCSGLDAETRQQRIRCIGSFAALFKGIGGDKDEGIEYILSTLQYSLFVSPEQEAA